MLAQHGLSVVLTSRNPSAGTQACLALHNEGLHNVVFHQLDVQLPESVAQFADWIKQEYGGLDILINNAGYSGVEFNEAVAKEHNINPQQAVTDPEATKKVFSNKFETGNTCLDINYYGVKRTVAALLPLFRPSPAGARIINISTRGGKLENLPNESLRKQFLNPDALTEEFVEGTIKAFLHDLKEGRLAERGWPEIFSAYKMSKITLNAYTRILARDLASRQEGQKIYANVVHPGWVQTDMSLHTGQFTVSESAETIVWVALLADGTPPSGQFFYKKEPYDF